MVDEGDDGDAQRDDGRRDDRGDGGLPGEGPQAADAGALPPAGGDVQQKDKKLRSAKMLQGKLDKFLARMDVKLDDLKVKEDAFEIAQPQLVGVAIIEVAG